MRGTTNYATRQTPINKEMLKFVAKDFSNFKIYILF